jgi:hypothetical protein
MINDRYKSLETLKDSDVYSIVLLLLFLLKDNPRYSTMSELSYILDHENFLKFINYYAGQTIEIPTIDEINSTLRVFVLYQYYIVEKEDWKIALHKAGFNPSESLTARTLLIKFNDLMENYKIGDFLNGDKK